MISTRRNFWGAQWGEDRHGREIEAELQRRGHPRDQQSEVRLEPASQPIAGRVHQNGFSR